ncbi:hypothetical protein F5J12DRAFT_62708 [Pisolithus orientalis]|uniref:uncharacterized protein n=1 Tax=Pisolithus orientalis TaxID=936130 RepID=UPI0022256907|nr:uncharacterized protein F5J12DRAFT_62708 [Pisolithus orientalis]KAI5984918.1 hypothetical protein F5J12DRAFT_62708 [Pisolithus orientalis]
MDRSNWSGYRNHPSTIPSTPPSIAEVADFVDWLVAEKHVTHPDGHTVLFEDDKSGPVSLVYRTPDANVIAVANHGSAHIPSIHLSQLWKAAHPSLQPLHRTSPFRRSQSSAAGSTPACCSDHQCNTVSFSTPSHEYKHLRFRRRKSFHAQGSPAATLRMYVLCLG